MNNFEQWYVNLLKDIVLNGKDVKDRTGTGTRTIFTTDYTHDMRDHYPILSCREFNYKQPITESIGFLKGITNSEWYKERGCPFWNGFGLPEDVVSEIRKEDHILANEYCSDFGKYSPTSLEYQTRYKEISQLPYEDGLKLITDYGVELYDSVVKNKKGDLGPIYGGMWRKWPNNKGGYFDQLEYAVNELLTRPYNRRILINGWNPSFMPNFSKKPFENVLEGNMSLTPCHVLHEYFTEVMTIQERMSVLHEYDYDYVEWNAFTDKERSVEELHAKLDEYDIPKYNLSLCWFQRSWDVVLGLPANFANYASILMMMAKFCNMVPKYLSVKGVNVHIYLNHLEGVSKIIENADLGVIDSLGTNKPKMKLNLRKDISFVDQFEVSDFELTNYLHLPKMSFPISF